MKKTTLVLALISMTAFGTLQAQIDRGGTTTETREKEAGKYETKGKEEKPKVTKADKAEKQDQMNKQDRQSSPASADAQSRAKEMTDKLDEVLDLTTEQYQKAMQVNLKYCNQLEEMKARNTGNDAATKEQMKAKKDELSRERLNQYKSFLTKEQWSKFEAHRGEVKEEYNSDKGNMSKEEKKERMENMTPEEKQKMQEKKDQKKGSN
jgi:hypothetical protein